MSRLGRTNRPGPGRDRPIGERSSPFRRWLHPAVGAALLALLLYAPTLRSGYVRDDHWLIEDSAPLHSHGGFAQLMASDLWAPAGRQSGLWRPVVVASYWLDARIAGDGPGVFHAMNALAHALTCGLLALVLFQAGVPTAGAWAGSLWFAAMPAHVESVAWISGRTDVYCALFSLLALWLDRRARRRRRRGSRGPALVALALALLSKEAAIPLAAVIAIADWAGGSGEGDPAGAARARRTLRWTAPYLAVTVAYGVIHELVARATVVAAAPGGPELAHKRWAALTLVPAYLRYLWPWGGHSPDRMLEIPASPLAPAVMLGATLGAVMALLGWRLVRRRSPLATPFALFWLPLLPAFAQVALGSYASSAERVVYLPSAGAAWVLGWGVGAIVTRTVKTPGPVGQGSWPAWARSAAIGAAALLVVASAWETLPRVPEWKSDETMYRSMTRREPRNPYGHVGLAEVLIAEGREEEARRQLDVAESLAPELPELHVTRANLYFRHADWPGVLESAGRALRSDSMRVDARLSQAHALLYLKRRDEVRAALDRMERLWPGHPGLEALRGQLLLVEGRAAEAIPHLERASRWVNDDPALFFSLGNARLLEGQAAGAAAAFERTVGLDPSYYDAWLRLAIAYRALGDAGGRDRALAHADALPEARDGRAAALRHEWSVHSLAPAGR